MEHHFESQSKRLGSNKDLTLWRGLYTQRSSWIHTQLQLDNDTYRSELELKISDTLSTRITATLQHPQGFSVRYQNGHRLSPGQSRLATFTNALDEPITLNLRPRDSSFHGRVNEIRMNTQRFTLAAQASRTVSVFDIDLDQIIPGLAVSYADRGITSVIDLNGESHSEFTTKLQVWSATCQDQVRNGGKEA